MKFKQTNNEEEPRNRLERFYWEDFETGTMSSTLNFIPDNSLLLFLCIGVFLASLSVCLEVLDSLGQEIQIAVKFWVLNPSPLEEQPVILTTEPSLQSMSSTFYVY